LQSSCWCALCAVYANIFKYMQYILPKGMKPYVHAEQDHALSTFCFCKFPHIPLHQQCALLAALLASCAGATGMWAHMQRCSSFSSSLPMFCVEDQVAWHSPALGMFRGLGVGVCRWHGHGRLCMELVDCSFLKGFGLGMTSNWDCVDVISAIYRVQGNW
jgi:hypothetical protein